MLEEKKNKMERRNNKKLAKISDIYQTTDTGSPRTPTRVNIQKKCTYADCVQTAEKRRRRENF